MKKNQTLLFAALSMAIASVSHATGMGNMEKCKVVKNGKGLIKANKADCKGVSHTCAGQNVAGDLQSWIMVPTGMCSKINAGEFGEVPMNIKDKIEGGN